MSQRVAAKALATSSSRHNPDSNPTLPTFLDHVHELQGRLFAIAITFILIAGAAYPFFDKLVAIIVAPLDKGQELVYLTPGGAFSFVIKVCMYVGIVGALPVIVYHLYRFLMPAVRQVHLRTVLGYTLASLVLAIIGIIFAYFVSLPAALHFLTSFNLYHINPMLTIDSYFSFVMTYILAGALLFQLPIVMLIINSVTPLTPSKMMGAQRAIIVGSFVAAAILSPTPDALNQALLASPMIVMYQVGLIVVWQVNRRSAKKLRNVSRQRVIELKPSELVSQPAQSKTVPVSNIQATTKTHQVINSPRKKMQSIDGFTVGNRRSYMRSTRPIASNTRSAAYRNSFNNAHQRSSVDGIFTRSLV